MKEPYLFIKPNGSKTWRLKYQFLGKEKTLSIGLYPDVSLSDARNARDNARRKLADKIDPGLANHVSKCSVEDASENSLEMIAREGFTKLAPTWSTSRGERILRCLEKDIFPWIGHRLISEITAPELLATLRRMESGGAIETAHRAHKTVGKSFATLLLQGALSVIHQGSERCNPPAKKCIMHPLGKRVQSANCYELLMDTKDISSQNAHCV